MALPDILSLGKCSYAGALTIGTELGAVMVLRQLIGNTRGFFLGFKLIRRSLNGNFFIWRNLEI